MNWQSPENRANFWRISFTRGEQRVILEAAGKLRFRASFPENRALPSQALGAWRGKLFQGAFA